jgi:cbb3-type cytochrome oxidase maturation protein
MILFLLIPLGLVLVGGALWAFFWAVGDGQFDDLETPGWAILGDERAPAGTTIAVEPAATEPATREQA